MIKNAYYQHFRKKLEEDLHGDTSGDFRRLLISMCACARDEASCDPALANNLAQQLYKAGQLSDLRLRIFFSRLFLEVRKSLVFLCSMEVFDYIRNVEKQNKIKQITSSFTER